MPNNYILNDLITQEKNKIGISYFFIGNSITNIEPFSSLSLT